MKLRLFLIACLVLTAGLLTAQNIFGAFQVITEPRGATVTVYGTNQYLGTTPTQSVPITMDQYMTYNWGVPGRVFDLVISKRGFIPVRQQIFVPYNHRHQRDALRNPTLFHFSLARQQIQPRPYWPYWNPTSYYYIVDPSTGYGPGNHACHGPGANYGHGGNHNPGGHNSGSHGGGNHQGGPGGNNNQGSGYNPPSGGHAGHPRP
ncbi:MAG: hypothetical protein PHG32_09110 [Candidatus Cloacimonetes bacterium]|nr:hypothetical protein [Candidatus Cloacimonadota bacterium]